jgi:hypothetical protein
MRKRLVLVFIAVFLTAALASAAPLQSFRDVWKSVQGRTGTLTAEGGGYVFKLVDNGGPIVVTYVGEDYVDFAARTNVQGQKTDHWIVPMARLSMRALQ